MKHVQIYMKKKYFDIYIYILTLVKKNIIIIILLLYLNISDIKTRKYFAP